MSHTLLTRTVAIYEGAPDKNMGMLAHLYFEVAD